MTLRLALAALSLSAAVSTSMASAQVPVGCPLASRSEDERLSQKVSARAVHQPLTTWLDQLSRETRVHVQTTPEYEDRLITLRVRDLPLGQLLDNLTALYGDRWLVKGAGAHSTYLLGASTERREKQRRLLAAFRQAMKDELTETVRSVLKDGPPEWMLEGTGGDREFADQLRARAGILSQLSPDALDQILSGQPIRVQLARATGPAGDALWSFAEKYAMPDSGGWKAVQRANGWAQFDADRYSLKHSELSGLPLRSLTFTFGTSSGGSSTYNIPVYADSLAARLKAALGRLREGEEQDPEQRRRHGGAMLQQIVPDRKEFVPGSALSRSEILVALAEAAGLNLVSDAHTKPRATFADLRRRTVEAALSEICDAYHCYWRVESPVVRVRSRYWWLDDSSEPPATSVVRWKAILVERGFLPLLETLAVASLTPEQQERLAVLAPETRPAFSVWYRFYASLDTKQRQAATSSKGLPLWSVPEAKRFLLVNLPPGDPMVGSQRLEESVLGAAVIFKVDGDATAPVQIAAGVKQMGRAVVFETVPVPDAAGKTHGAKMRIIVPLPQRPAAGGPGAPKPPQGSGSSPSGND
jgi:hypothetical protein